MKLRSRIVLATTLVFATISLLAGWLMLIRAETSLQTAFDRAAQTRADWLLSLVSVDPVVLPVPAANEQMLVHYMAYGQTRELFRSPEYPNDERSTPFAETYRIVTSRSNPESVPASEIMLKLGVEDTSLQQDIRQIRWTFGLGWLASLLLAFGVGYVVAGWLLRPIQRIANQANTINDALSIDLIKLPDSRDELFQLTDTLNQMLRRIRENAEQQRNFFGAAAHELRTPLAVMKTGLEVTITGEYNPEQVDFFLKGQLDEVSRLSRLLDEFLTLSRPDFNEQQLNYQEVNLMELVDKSIGQLSSLTSEYGVGVGIWFGNTEDKTIVTDAIKLEHIVLNLIENAIKYAIEKSNIQIHVTCDSVWTVRIQNQTVRESGPTVDLTQPYFQADPLKEGHGLGLWISARLTRLLEGNLALDWQNFTFTSTLHLPLLPVNQHLTSKK
ncbi:HAMP domain-containing histidine kinase [Spirosoma sp. BT702]|uniref:histidine kinase n=1 Tax=Spirosoma profusum TaxID=2771354 RepID=A0A927AV07_9BACT|nr:HAMP domain-containing sensor histidine kinase [Spirosoma profusum]MBD2704914.1 HAMP domain-containing histidine kinase [Spirosoma profusum]